VALTRVYIESDRGDKIQASADSRIFYNPNLYTVTKKVTWKSVKVKGLDVPVQHFQTGEPRTLALSLVFDTYEQKKDVRELTGQLAALCEVNDDGKPDVCRFFWGPDQKNPAALAFQGVIESLTQKFTLFLEDGTPVRATVDLALKESESPKHQLQRTKRKKGSPLQARRRVTKLGDTLWGIAAAEYQDAAQWRPIALANGIQNPRELPTGILLLIPPLG
jgi:hypothetical protein